MSNIKKHFYFFLLFLVILETACGTYSEIAKTTYYPLDSLAQADSNIVQLIAPYKKQLSSEMDEVIGTLAMDMPKAQPESLLGNWVADAILDIAQQEYEEKIDFAVSNYGGLRVPYLIKGDITRGNIFELMPFDNMLVVVQLNASQLETFAQHIANKEGWPVSASFQMNINKEQTINYTIDKQAVDTTKVYHVVVSDYMANGGDKCKFLVDLPRTDLGLLFRDALLKYVIKQTEAGQVLSSQLEGRIVVEK